MKSKQRTLHCRLAVRPSTRCCVASQCHNVTEAVSHPATVRRPIRRFGAPLHLVADIHYDAIPGSRAHAIRVCSPDLVCLCVSRGLMTCGNCPPGLLSIFLWHSSLEHITCVTPKEREAEDRCGNVSISLGFNKPTNQSDPVRVRRCARSSGSKSRLCSGGLPGHYRLSGRLFQWGTRCL